MFCGIGHFYCESSELPTNCDEVRVGLEQIAMLSAHLEGTGRLLKCSRRSAIISSTDAIDFRGVLFF